MNARYKYRVAWRRKILPYIALVVLITLSVMAWRFYTSIAMERDQHRFDALGEVVADRISERLSLYSMILQGGAGLFAASEDVSRDEWRTYLEIQQAGTQYSGARDFGVTTIVHPLDLAVHIQQVKDEGLPDYTVWPAGERDQYAPIVLIENYGEGEGRMLGYDVLADPVLRDAATRARDSGSAAISSHVTRKSGVGAHSEPEFMMFYPFYAKNAPLSSVVERRASIIGYFFATFPVKYFLKDVFPDNNEMVDFLVYDFSEDGTLALLYNSRSSFSGVREFIQPTLRSRKILHVGGNQWVIDFESTAVFEETMDRYAARGILAAGLIISLLMFLFLKRLEEVSDRGFALAGKMTSALRESEERFKCLFRNSPVSMLIYNKDTGKIVDANEAALALYRYSSLRDMQKDIFSLDPPYSREDALAMIRRATSDSVLRYEWMSSKSTGEILWEDVHLIAVMINGVERVLVTAIDITERRRTEESLKQEQALTRALMDNLPDQIYFKDAISRFIRVNPSLARRHGMKDPAEAIGRSDADFFSEEHARSALLSERDIVRTGQPVLDVDEMETWPDGSVTWVRTSKLPLRMPDGSIIGTCGISRDITERKQAENYREISRETLMIFNEPGFDLEQSMKRIVAVIKERGGFDAVGICVRAGDDFLYIAEQGFSSEHLLAESLPIIPAANGGLCRDENGNFCLECVCGVVVSGKSDMDHPSVTKVGSFWTNDGNLLLSPSMESDLRRCPLSQRVQHDDASMAMVPVRDEEKIVGLIHLRGRRKGCFSCTTIELLEPIAGHLGAALMRKRAEEALLAANRNIQAASDAKSAFLANMSHEIRTPMNAVIGMSDLLMHSGLNPNQMECASVIRTSGETLVALINDILDLSKIEAGRLEVEELEFELVRCIEETLEMVAVRSTDKNIKLTCDIGREVPPAVCGDACRLRQILLNLLSNALKFTHEGMVGLSVSSRPVGEGFELMFAVHDTGIGIAQDRLDVMFEAFTQADGSTTRHYGGTGLGLTISRRLCELMGGRIWAESVVGKGSDFCFTIHVAAARPNLTADAGERKLWSIDLNTPSPLGKRVSLAGEKAPISGERQPPKYGSEGRPLRLLVVEDNLLNQKVVMRMLSKLGYAADLASDGVEALEMLEAQEYDIVLMDIQMPRMDGLTATQEIHARSIGRKRPIIIGMTAHAASEERTRGFAAGMDDYLTKPVQMVSLGRALRKYEYLSENHERHCDRDDLIEERMEDADNR